MPADQTFDRPPLELAHDRFIIGTPDDLVATADRYAAELGVTTLILRVQWPGLNQQQVLDQIRLISQAVLPRIAAIAPTHRDGVAAGEARPDRAEGGLAGSPRRPRQCP